MQKRLQKIISDGGVASRRAAEDLITAGRVRVNGEVAALGQSADPDTDTVEVDGVRIISAEKLYICLNKPRGVVTTLSDEKNRRNAAQLVRDLNVRVYPVGRLDMDSEGLLLMTNDGAFANRVTHPSGGITKDYLVWVTGDKDLALPTLRSMRDLDGEPIAPVLADTELYEGETVLKMTLSEGRNRQIRRMCDSAGLSVKRLLRIRVGGIFLGDLKPGHWRALTKHELASFE